VKVSDGSGECFDIHMSLQAWAGPSLNRESLRGLALSFPEVV
jgi:hypothetical protein